MCRNEFVCILCARSIYENQQLNLLHIKHINNITINIHKKNKIKYIIIYSPVYWVYYGTYM